DLDALRRLGEDTVKRRLEGLAGVALARVSGGRERQVVIEPDPYLLKSYGLTAANLRQQIQAANVDASGGEIEDNERMYIVHAAGAFQGLDEIRGVTVGYRRTGQPGAQTVNQQFATEKVPITLDEVADVRYEYKEVESLVRLDGVECVGVSVYKEADENTVRVVETVMEELVKIERDAGDITLVMADDQARFIKTALNEVYQTMAYGVLLAVFILFVFLRNFRTTLIVCLAFPISIVATFNLMYFSELTLNIMTLGGLALGAGMLVDSAIVVVENIYRHRQSGAGMLESAVTGSTEVAAAITAATITTVVVFLPIVFVRGIAGQLFKEQAITVAFSLVCSLMVALAVIPAAASKYLVIEEKHLSGAPKRPLLRAVVGVCVDHKFVVTLLALSLGGYAVYLLPQIGNEFVPTGDEGQFRVELRLPEGTRIETTEQFVREAERIIETTGGAGVSTVFARIGQTEDEVAILEQEDSGDNSATLSVLMARPESPEGALGQWAERLGLVDLFRMGEVGLSSEALVAAINPTLSALPEAEVSFVLNQSTLQQTMGMGDAPIIVRLRGPNLDTLRTIAENAAARMAELPEIYNVQTSFEGGHPEVEIVLDKMLAGRFGLDTQQVAAIVRQKVDGEVISDFMAEDEQRDIELVFPDMSLRGLRAIEIENYENALLTLTDIAELNVIEGPRTIERFEQERAGTVTASPADGVSFSDGVQAVRDALAGVPVPPRYRIEVAGQEELRADSFRTLGLAMILAIALVYMVLAGQFESLIHPFVILLTVPLAGTGVVFAFFLLSRPFSVMAFIGVIMLAGIAVNDSIVLVDYINQLRRRGAARRDAILEAVQTRLRPIVMTSLTTILVLMPLSLGIGESARLRAPMAIAVIAGLCASTLLTLLVIPALYALLDGLRRSSR
ncbi:MAG: efflux RND transporter permease subunit, partial [Candidatus Hydrogenedentes bacterium]|nr:efflux RND transporter permease subunit [Candidatus Hydrogenedentota bacterium]